MILGLGDAAGTEWTDPMIDASRDADLLACEADLPEEDPPCQVHSGPRRIALLHLVPRFGDLSHNRDLLERAVRKVAAEGADWMITPEMWLCGWSYPQTSGSAWIEQVPDGWPEQLAATLSSFGMTAFISYPEREPDTGLRYNPVVAIDGSGALLGTYRKRNLIPGPEAWASRGDEQPVFDCGGKRVGVIVCADADGTEPNEDFRASESAVVVGGRRVACWSPSHSTAIVIDWDPSNDVPADSFQEIRV